MAVPRYPFDLIKNFVALKKYCQKYFPVFFMVESSFRCLLLLRGLRCDKFTDLSQTHRERNIFLDNEALKNQLF